MDDPMTEEQRQAWLQSLIDAEPEDGAFCGQPSGEIAPGQEPEPEAEDA